MKPKKLITLGSYHTDYFLIGDRIPDVSYRITCNNGNQRTLINP